MKTTLLFLTLYLTMLVLSCSPVTVSHDYDPQTNFNKLKTFTWMRIPRKANVNQLMVKRIKDAVTRELVAKGLTENSISPDFLIAMHGTSKEKWEIQDWGYSRHRALYWGDRDISVRQYNEGTLILDFIDAKTKQLIWRGIAKGAVDPEATPKERTKRINDGIAELLEQFPPVQ